MIETVLLCAVCCQTEWGTYKLTAAVKVMMRQGLEDTHNQQFLLLSDTGVPTTKVV